MSIFANVSPITSTESDTIRTGKFTLDSGVYPAVIKMAFVTNSKSSQAKGVKFEFAVNVEGKTRKHFETIWIAGRDGSFQKADKDGKMQPTFGMQQLDTIAKLTLGTGVETLSTDVCKIEVKKGEALQDCDVFRSLINQPLMLGLKEVRKNKQANVNGTWTDINEERLENVVDKFFDRDGKTILERQGNAPAAFIETWKENFAGKVDDRFKPVAGAPAMGGAAAGVSSGSLI